MTRVDDEDIPVSEKAVQAEILRADVPWQIARLAAGQHQRQQSDTRDISTFDIMSMLALVAERRLEATNSAMDDMDDNLLFSTLEQLGMVSDCRKEEINFEIPNPIGS